MALPRPFLYVHKFLSEQNEIYNGPEVDNFDSSIMFYGNGIWKLPILRGVYINVPKGNEGTFTATRHYIIMTGHAVGLSKVTEASHLNHNTYIT